MREAIPPFPHVFMVWCSVKNRVKFTFTASFSVFREHSAPKFCVKYGKVKLSLPLNKCHALKTFPILNQAPRHEEVWRSGGITLCIRWKWVTTFTPRPLYLRERSRVPIGQGVGWAPDPVWTHILLLTHLNHMFRNKGGKMIRKKHANRENAVSWFRIYAGH